MRSVRRGKEGESNKALFILAGLFSLVVGGLVYYIYVSQHECAANVASVDDQLASKVSALELSTKEVAKLKKELSASRAKAKDLEEENAQKEKQISKLEQEAQDQQDSYQQQLAEKDNLIKNKDFELKYSADNLDEAKQKVADLEARAEQATEAKESFEVELHTLKGELDECKEVRGVFTVVALSAVLALFFLSCCSPVCTTVCSRSLPSPMPHALGNERLWRWYCAIDDR
uniref:Uncharacterized protein n=1 Tax=Palpitomonas bilix TaxID=652834 RepID=A0A7S3LTH1_9EUKA|mmetsp:Transcript_457/g.834  ORF Transcript_457/g.834 Transcript_457/m.834 type:complete len:231 (+) Transcript_457:178-870(+)